MIRIVCGTVVAAMLATAAQCGEGSAARIGNAAAKPRIWFNEDNEHFYTYHSGDEMTAEGCRGLVRTYAGFGEFAGVLYCINLQRALFDSDAWERFKDIDSTLQPDYAGHVRLLSERGVDQFAEFLDETRRQDMSAWLTMRMNDCHGLKEAAHGDAKCRLAPWRTDLWAKHPELRRAPYRDERSWEGAFDWGNPAIRERALALVREAFGKWDFDGFEFDWLRWGMYFKPGAEREGAELLNAFMEEVVKIRDAAERRVGHSIALGHRVPPDPRAALNHGFDVARWAELGGVQMLTLSTFENACEFDMPVSLWRRLLRPGTKVNVAIGRRVSANQFNSLSEPQIGSAVMFFMRGAAAAAWAARADGVYLFNECYMEPKKNAALEKYLHEIGAKESLARLERWTAVTCEVQVMPGDSNRAVLPMPLSCRYIGCDFSRMEQNMTVRLSAPLATPETVCTLDLAFDSAAPDDAVEKLAVRVNTEIVARKGSLVRLARDNVKEGPENGFATFGDGKDLFPRDAAKVVSFEVPGRLLRDFYNAVELEPEYGTPGHLVWAQFRLSEKCENEGL